MSAPAFLQAVVLDLCAAAIGGAIVAVPMMIIALHS